MLKFDPQKIEFDIVRLKSVTMALDGSMTILDEKHSTDKKEVTKRVHVPLAVVRAFIQANKKVTKYVKPVYTAVARYGDHILALERHPLAGMGKLEENGRRWKPMMELNWLSRLLPHLKQTATDWYFDGRFIFSFKIGKDADTIARHGEFLTSDGKFRKCVADCFDLQSLPFKDELLPKERSCLAFVSSRGAAISPPIWKDLAGVGAKNLGKDEEEEDDVEVVRGSKAPADSFNFDKIDAQLNVNLNFALKAGVLIGKTFGYEYVEPLQLPRLMVELRTVNLPTVPLQVKATYDIHMQFTHALAWLLGMSRRADTLETYIMMRSLMKYLTKKGVFRSSVFDARNVFKEEFRAEDVKAIPLDVLLADENYTEKAKQAMFDQLRNKRKRKQEHENLSVGGLLNEEG